jgi:hypothetical protein
MKRDPDSLVDATTTPLASILGSGFLVIVLAHVISVCL